MRAIEHVTVGKRDVELTAPSHVAGVRQGNRPRKHRPADESIDGAMDGSLSTRSTGINADDRAPIDPAMPKLTPP